ncbi:MAG: hypothetical protein J6O89_01060 [Aeriscardovia sp.]|nr:hypothetical protein [Aeriscardovia sp.]
MENSNIELKEVLNFNNRTSDEVEKERRKIRERCKKQIMKHFKLLAHPLCHQSGVQKNIMDFLKNHLFCYGICFEDGNFVCYQVKDESTVDRISPCEIVKSLPTTTSWINEETVKRFFSQGNLLVSPLTDEEEWQHGLYVLSDLENTREKELIKSLTDIEARQNKKPFYLIGDAGTGKTLLLFDVAKEIGKKQQDRTVVFCPQREVKYSCDNYICRMPFVWLEVTPWRQLLGSGINFYPQFNFIQPPNSPVLKYVYIQNILCKTGTNLPPEEFEALIKQECILRCQIDREIAGMNSRELKKYIYLNLFEPFFKGYNYIFVDESQLLDSTIYSWLINLNNQGKNIVFCTDPCQTFTGECCEGICDKVNRRDKKKDLHCCYLDEEIRQNKEIYSFCHEFKEIFIENSNNSKDISKFLHQNRNNIEILFTHTDEEKEIRVKKHIEEGYQYIGFPVPIIEVPAGTELPKYEDHSEFIPGIMNAINSKEALGKEYDKVITILSKTVIQNMGKYNDQVDRINYLNCIYINITRAISKLCLIISD